MTNSIKYTFVLPLLAVSALGSAISAFAIDLLELPAVQTGQAAQALLLDVTPRGSEGFVAVGEYGVIIVSEDGGESWTQAQVPASVTLNGVYFPTAESGWAVGHDGLILHSEDGGHSWQKQLDGYQLNEQVISVAERIVEKFRARVEALQAGQAADQGGEETAAEDIELLLDDAEFMLEEAEFMLEGAMDDVEAGPVRPLLDVWFRNPLEGFVVGSYGMLLHTVDGGGSWELVSDRIGSAQAYHLNQIVSAPDGTLLIAGESGYVYRSKDGGQSWESLQPGYEGSFYGIVIVPGDTEDYELLAYGLRGNLFSSLDGGDSWLELDSGTEITLTTGMALPDRSVVLAGQAGLILMRPAGQQSFRAVQNPDRRVISGIAQQTDGHLLLVGLGGVRLAQPDGAPLASETESP
jgi:photosystem II stability/assembly factor-like uncharacterized protein